MRLVSLRFFSEKAPRDKKIGLIFSVFLCILGFDRVVPIKLEGKRGLVYMCGFAKLSGIHIIYVNISNGIDDLIKEWLAGSIGQDLFNGSFKRGCYEG